MRLKNLGEKKEQTGKFRVLPQSLEQGNQKQKRNDQRNEQRRNNGQGGNNLLLPTIIASNGYCFQRLPQSKQLINCVIGSSADLV